MFRIIYEYLKPHDKLPYIHKDRKHVKAVNMELVKEEKKLCYLPLWNKYERRGASRKGTVALHYLNQCESLYSAEVNMLCGIEWDP